MSRIHIPHGAEALDFITMHSDALRMIGQKVLLVPKVTGDTRTTLVAGMGERYSTNSQGAGGEAVAYPNTHRQGYTRSVLDAAILIGLATTNNLEQALGFHLEADRSGNPRTICTAQRPEALADLDAELHVVALDNLWEPSRDTHQPTKNGNTLRQAVWFDTASPERVAIIGTVALGVADMEFSVMCHPHPSEAFNYS